MELFPKLLYNTRWEQGDETVLILDTHVSQQRQTFTGKWAAETGNLCEIAQYGKCIAKDEPREKQRT